LRFEGKIILIAIVDFSPVARRTHRRTKTVQYLLLIYSDEKDWSALDEATQVVEMGKCMAYGKEFAEQIKGSNALQPSTTATTVRMRNGKRLTTDGPFAETKEQLAGYYLVEAANLDEAIAMAEKNPVAPHGSIEVRPIRKFS
jgi:hypothetical protein